MRSIKKVILTTLVLCVGVGIIVASFRRVGLVGVHPTSFEIEPFSFSFGLAICIISGVVLLKAIRDYLAGPKN